MTQQKLYTEEQVREAYLSGMYVTVSFEEVLQRLTPIELPTDEEIKKEAKDNCEYNQYSLRQFDSKFIDTFIDGAKWMRDKIQGGDK